MSPALRRCLVLSACAGMEMGWLFLLCRLVAGVVGLRTGEVAAAPTFPPPWVVLLLPVSLGICGLVRRWVGWKAARFVAWAAVGAALMLGLLSLGFNTALYVALPAYVVLWGAGLRLAFGGTARETAVREFQLGIVALVVVLAVSYLMDLELQHAAPTAAACLVLGLLGVAFANERGSMGTLGRGRWWGVLLLSVAAVGGVALLAVAVVTPGVLETLWQAVVWCGRKINTALAMIGNLIPDPTGGTGATPPAPGAPGAESEIPDGVLPGWLLRIVRTAFSIFVVVCTAAVVWLLSRRLFAFGRRATQGRGEVESLHGAFRLDLKRWARALANWLKGFFRRHHFGQTAATLSQGPPEIASVREMYRLLLRRAARKGIPRRGFETPCEYEATLAEAILATSLDGEHGALRRLTNAYIDARYGAVPPTPSELQELGVAWRRLEHHL
ncbi:MAG: DUF4129 domain-containing protein [Gaiellales bacterium]|nr:DUF4129 domain-containing protein [Gaiellales bacterium]